MSPDCTRSRTGSRDRPSARSVTGALGDPRRLVDRRVHRRRRPRVRPSRSCRSQRRAGGRPTSARHRLRRRADQPMLAGRSRIHRVGHRPHVEPDHGGRIARRWPLVRSGRRRRSAVRRSLLRRRRGLSRVRAHRCRRRRRSPRSLGCSSPAGRSPSSSITRCCRRRAAAGSTTRSSIRPSSTGASVRTSSSRVDRGGRARRPHPVHPPPAVSLRQHPRRARSGARADDRAGAAGGFLARAPSTRDAATIPRLLYLRLANAHTE
jgi:hypothetical protein